MWSLYPVWCVGDCTGLLSTDPSRFLLPNSNEDTDDLVPGILEIGGGVGGSLTRVCLASGFCTMLAGFALGSSGGGGRGGEGDRLLPMDLMLPAKGGGGAGKLGALCLFPVGSTISCPCDTPGCWLPRGFTCWGKFASRTC